METAIKDGPQDPGTRLLALMNVLGQLGQRTRRAAVRRFASVAALVALASAPALAQTPPDGSIWRPNLADQRAKLNLIDRTGVHGTYQSEMYLLFLKDAKTGALGNGLDGDGPAGNLYDFAQIRCFPPFNATAPQT